MNEATEQQNIPLHDKEAERAVLGALLMEPTVYPRVLPILTENQDVFFTVDHQLIYAAVNACYDKKQTTDILVVADYLSKRDELKRVGGTVYLYDLQARIVETENVEYHAQIVRERAMRRQLVQRGKTVSELAYDEERDITHLIDAAQQEVFELGKVETKKGLKEVGGLVTHTIKELAEMSEKGVRTPGLPTGYTDLDILTSGLYPGELVILAARPNRGKTSFALNVALNVALREDTDDAIAFFSLEMPKRQLALRMLASEAPIPFSRLRTSDVKETEWGPLTAAATLLQDNSHRILLADDFGITINEIRQECRRLKSKTGNLRLVVVDYIQQVEVDKSGNQNREQVVAEVSRSLKQIAGELDITVIACSQLNREVEKQNRKPVLSDLRESGAIEQDADLVAFLHNESELPNQEESEVELLVRKQRNGATGDVLLRFFGPIMRFSDITTES